MLSNDKIIVLTKDEFFTPCLNKNNQYDINKIYQAYEKEISQAIEVIKCLVSEKKSLTRERNKYKKIAKNFTHTTITEKQVKDVIKYLKERYTIKEVAEKVGISTSTVSRIKKEKGITKKKLTSKKKSVE